MDCMRPCRINSTYACRLVSDERFNEYLNTIGHNDMSRRETQKRAQDKLKSSPGSNEDSHAYSGIIPNKERKEVKKTSKGEAIF